MKSKDIELELRQFESSFVYNIKTHVNRQTGLTEINDWVIESLFIELFNNLYKKSIEENYFWEYCSFKTYKETFQNRLAHHKIEFTDDDLDDFINLELEKLNELYYSLEELRDPYDDEILQFEYPPCFIFSFENTPLSLSISLNILENNLIYKISQGHSKKIKFLNELKLHNSTIIDEHNKSEINFKVTPNGTTELKQPYLIEKVSTKENEEILIAKHENIFSNNGFILFDHILNEYVKTGRGRKSDIHFFYWSMYNNDPQYIHQRPEVFKKWFHKKYEPEELGKIKTYLQVENKDRRKHYSNALDWFKQQPKLVP